MAFEAHGEYELSISGEIVIIRFFNTWNLEGAQEFFETYKGFIMNNKLKKFGVISDLGLFEGGTPEAMDFFSVITEWAFNNGQIARATIMDSGYKKYTIGRIDKGMVRFPSEVFAGVDQAVSWMKSLNLSNS